MIVKVIQRKGGKALIEWSEDGRLTRSIVPSDAVSEDGQIANPQYGIPAAFNFADYVHVSVSPQDIERSLHNAGIWTVEDLLSRPREVQGAINAAYGAVLQDLLTNVREFQYVTPKVSEAI